MIKMQSRPFMAVSCGQGYWADERGQTAFHRIVRRPTSMYPTYWDPNKIIVEVSHIEGGGSCTVAQQSDVSG